MHNTGEGEILPRKNSVPSFKMAVKILSPQGLGKEDEIHCEAPKISLAYIFELMTR